MKLSQKKSAESRNEVLKSRKQKYFPYYYADEWLNGTVVNRISFKIENTFSPWINEFAGFSSWSWVPWSPSSSGCT